MNILQVGILVFVFIEILNVLTLYFAPGSKKGNGLGVFTSYEELKKDQRHGEFVTYLVNWVAGAKLIFIMLSLVIVFYGNYTTHVFSVVALIISILSFNFKLYPIIKSLDKKEMISPHGYSKALNIMINTMIIGFITILVISHI